MAVATKTRPAAAVALRTKARKGRTPVTAADVRAWGRANGHVVKDGPGRLSLALVDAFHEANPKSQYLTGTGNGSAQPQKFPYTTASGRKGVTQPVTVSEIRAWAQEQPEVEVGAKGRLTQEVIDLYGRAHARARAPRKAQAAADEAPASE